MYAVLWVGKWNTLENEKNSCSTITDLDIQQIWLQRCRYTKIKRKKKLQMCFATCLKVFYRLRGTSVRRNIFLKLYLSSAFVCEKAENLQQLRFEDLCLRIAGKRFDELALIILFWKVRKRREEKVEAFFSPRKLRINLLTNQPSIHVRMRNYVHILVKLAIVSIRVGLVCNPVQKHFISSRNQIGFICVKLVKWFVLCGEVSKNF